MTNSPKSSPATAARELLKRRGIRASLAAWARACGYEPAAHHLHLIAQLERLSRGDIRRLMVFMPPGSAKSTYASVLFPAWHLARPGDGGVLTASHTVELAERFGRKVRNLVAQHDAALGYGVSIDSASAGRWETTTGREYYAAGIGVGIAGFRAGLGIIDDPTRSRQDAESKLVRERIWEWFNDDFSTRLIPGAGQALIMTRWHEDDLAGRILARDDDWTVVKLPALAGHGDPIGRAPGEWLWEGDYGFASLMRERHDTLTKSDPRSWSALYQQEPTPETGDYFRRDWLVPVPRDLVPPRGALRIYGGSDYAVTSDGGDYTVHAVIGVDSDGKPWLLDIWRRQGASDEWVDAWCDLVIKWKPLEWAEETGQIKSGVGPFLLRRALERKAFVARSQFPTRGDKAVRAQAMRGRVAMHGLRYAADAPWRAEFEAELLRFPAGVHDDQVDAIGLVGQMLDRMNNAAAPKQDATPRRDMGYRSERRVAAGSMKVL